MVRVLELQWPTKLSGMSAQGLSYRSSSIARSTKALNLRSNLFFEEFVVFFNAKSVDQLFGSKVLVLCLGHCWVEGLRCSSFVRQEATGL